MPDADPALPQVPESRAVSKKRTRISLVWVIPIVAAVAGVWIAVSRILSQGPDVTITFLSAEGLVPGKTKIKYSGLDVGTIMAVRLGTDNRRFVATARMVPRAEGLLFKDTSFWVVRPRISGLTISGLGTLLTGDYIGMQMGQSKEEERNFVALENPPLTGNVPGHLFTLQTPELGSLGQGSPVYYRRLQAGQVVAYDLDKTGKFLNVQIFVESPYDQFVTPNTRFWNASGIDVSLSTDGLKVHTESLLSIIMGGVAFGTPEGEPALPAAAATNTLYTLFGDREAAFKPPAHDPQTYVLIFEQSVRGLTVGAPVEFEGVRIGEVTEVHAEFDGKTHHFSVPVTISVDPARFGVQILDVPGIADREAEHRVAMDTMVARGLRAQLKTASLLTGSLYVAANFFPDEPPVTVDWSQKPARLPTVPGQLETMEANVASILKKVDQMEFKEISSDLRKALGDFDQTLASLRGTFTNADHVLGSADALLAPNSSLVGGLDGTLHEVSGAARSLRVLADYLERHPEALIRGKTGEAK